jgi:hypothetical protein
MRLLVRAEKYLIQAILQQSLCLIENYSDKISLWAR